MVERRNPDGCVLIQRFEGTIEHSINEPCRRCVMADPCISKDYSDRWFAEMLASWQIRIGNRATDHRHQLDSSTALLYDDRFSLRALTTFRGDSRSTYLASGIAESTDKCITSRQGTRRRGSGEGGMCIFSAHDNSFKLDTQAFLQHHHLDESQGTMTKLVQEVAKTCS